jgi:hypothetical protein
MALEDHNEKGYHVYGVGKVVLKGERGTEDTFHPLMKTRYIHHLDF